MRPVSIPAGAGPRSQGSFSQRVAVVVGGGSGPLSAGSRRRCWAPVQGWRYTHTTILMGFSTRVAKAASHRAASAPSSTLFPVAIGESKSTHPELKEFATKIAKDQQNEIKQMKSWATSWFGPL